MSQKAKFTQQINADKETDRRAEIEEVEDDEPEQVKGSDLAQKHLDEIYDFIKGKKEDDIVKDCDINRIHYHLISEFADRKFKKKKFVLSDGNCEMLALVHSNLKKLKKI